MKQEYNFSIDIPIYLYLKTWKNLKISTMFILLKKKVNNLFVQ